MLKPGHVVLIGITAFLVLILAFLPGGIASGQVPTVTPQKTATITAPAPYQVATFADVANSLECPVGNPAGWMTVTPGASWDFLCGQCFFTPAPTSTARVSPTAPWAGTGTPAANCTPMPAGTGTPAPYCNIAMTSTPVVTGTPIPGAAVTCGSQVANWSCEQLTSKKIKFTGYSGNSYPYIANPVYFLPVSGTLYYHLYSSGGASIESQSEPNYGTGTNIYLSRIGQYHDSIHQFTEIEVLSVNGGRTASTRILAGDYFITVPQGIGLTTGFQLVPGDSWSTLKYLAFNLGGGSSFIEVSTEPIQIIPTSTPVAIGTPNPNYCGSVQSAESDLTNNNVFAYSGFQVGGTSCFDLGGPGYDVNAYDFGTLLNGFYQFFADDPEAWIAHICLQGLNIGVVKVMGMEISLHIFALVAGLGLLIRNMFIS